jgi:competence protein ComEC
MWPQKGLSSLTARAGFHERVDVETEKIDWEDKSSQHQIGIRLNIYSAAKGDYSSKERVDVGQISPPLTLPTLHYGQLIRFAAALNPPRNYRNPGAFDYESYLRKQGITELASTKYAKVEILPGFAGNRLELWRTRIHRSIVNQIHSLWPEQIAGLIDAIVIGEESFIERPTRVDFQRSGTYHVLVVSGMNVSILAMFTLWLLHRFALGEIAASIFAIVLILAYATLTNVGPPVWRAALMFAVYLATRLLYRDRAMLNALGAAALALLIADPNALFGASFQLTFLCIILVAGIGIPLLERTFEPYKLGLRNLDAFAYDRSLPPRVAQFRLDLRLLINRIATLFPEKTATFAVVGILRISVGFLELVAISAIMQLGLALPMAYYFHRATSVAMPANLLVVPFLKLLMPAATLAIALSYASLLLAKIPALVAGLALHGIAGTVKWLGGMRLADIRVPTPGLFAIAFCCLAIFLCAALMRRRVFLSVIGACVLAASAIWIWTVPSREQIHPAVLEMTAIDVGQGDSILLVLPDGHKLLVDAGGLPFWTHSQLDIGEDVVSPYLWSRGISRLDAVALTHTHADHMGGMPAVISNFRPRELWLPEGIRTEEIERLANEARAFGVLIVHRRNHWS